MRFVTFTHAGATATGLLLADRVLALAPAVTTCGESVDVSTVQRIIEGGATTLAALARVAARHAELGAHTHALAQVTLLAPIPKPNRNVFCVGRNYLDHVKEGSQAMQTEMKLPSVPQFFTKATHAVTGPDSNVLLFSVSRRYDYEAELVVVIGQGGRNIKKDQALAHVFGYSIGNDVTARDLQRRHDQWFKGKSLDTSFPFGPALVTRDEIADVTQLEVTMQINGAERQRAHVSQMIFDIPSIIESLSAGLTLEPGDIIATGTPAGVGFAMDPPQYLQTGDEMIASITQLGQLRNRCVASE